MSCQHDCKRDSSSIDEDGGEGSNGCAGHENSTGLGEKSSITLSHKSCLELRAEVISDAWSAQSFAACSRRSISSSGFSQLAISSSVGRSWGDVKGLSPQANVSPCTIEDI